MQSSGKFRWIIVVLLFFATTINYLDRQVIGLLKDYLAADLNWSEQDYSRVVMAFTTAYALGLFLFGRLIDRIGTKSGFGISIVIWSLAAIGHGLVKSTLGFGVMRTLLGLGEAGNFPAAIKAVAEWFPKRERAFATGIFNSGTNVAAVFGPFLVMWIYSNYGWREAFIGTGAIGFAWLIFWQIYYDVPHKKKNLTKSELEFIHHDEGGDKEGTRRSGLMNLLWMRETWAYAAGKFFSDPIWWFYLFWIPSYFNTIYHIDLPSSWIYVSTIYFVASFGSVGGGYLSGSLISNGWPVNRARKTVMLFYAFCVLPITLIKFTSDVWTGVALISFAAAAHQAWSATIFTTISDRFPKSDVSSIVGIGGLLGSLGSILFPFVIGVLLDHFRKQGNIDIGYHIIFVVCGCSYSLAWMLMHLINPKNTNAQF
jgi:MFS transporter, ACS family, hexuronate transporter